VVPSVASGDEYLARLDDGSTGAVYALPAVIRPGAAGVRLTSAASCDPEVVDTRTVDTLLFVCSAFVHDP